MRYNNSYFPILCRDSDHREEVLRKLGEKDIFPRKYFYPSLDTVAAYGSHKHCVNSASVSERILCLPIYCDLEMGNLTLIAEIINKTLK